MSGRYGQFRRSSHGGIRRGGAILIVALVVVFTMCGMILALCQEMRIEAIAAGNRAGSAQASAIELGAEQYVLGTLSDSTQSPFDLTDDQFSSIQVGDGYFWVVRPDYDDPTLPIYGLTSEAGKININSASDTLLTNMLNGDTDTSSAIQSWRGSTSTTTSDDSSYYSMQPDPYTSKGFKYETVEELLMVRNITRPLLYGDGTAAPLGQRTNVMAQPSANNILTDAQIARGLFDLLTVYSVEPKTAPDGSALVALNTTPSQGRTARPNTTGLQKLFTQVSVTGGSSILGKIGTRTPLADIFDLATKASMTSTDVDAIADYIAAPTGTSTAGSRIDVNTAPAAVLYSLVGVGGIKSSDIDTLISQRQSIQPEQGQLGWVADALKGRAAGLGRYITGRTYQYSADIVAVSGNGRSYKHCRVVVDTSGVSAGGLPQILYRRDITDRGWPMDPQILANLRTGKGLGNLGGANTLTIGGSHG